MLEIKARLESAFDLPNPAEEFDAELQLQQELQSLFAVDTQKDLQSYFNLVKRFKSSSWTQEIQEIYRLIHTIKGGAVTIHAEAILAVATVLENLLSDLRYLETPPSDLNKWLRDVLNEGGELLASVISDLDADNTEDSIQHKVERINELRQQIQEKYLPEWNEQVQLQKEFAEQGFDLVVLDLEMAVNKLSETEPVSDEAVTIAEQTLEQLAEIGEDIQLASGWTTLLEQSKELLTHKEGNLWRTQWPIYFQTFKTCIKEGGKTVAAPLPTPEEQPQGQKPELPTLEKVQPVEPRVDIRKEKEKVQIPIPLERIERSTQHLIDTLLTTRATYGVYEDLHQQLLQLKTLAQENVNYVTHLRQLQDDYALLGDNHQTSEGGLSPERYRKGYATINRLLENSLRLSELGSETEKSSLDTARNLQELDQHILKLRNTLEDSRLVPFQNLCFRARAILRDLSNRYNKPVQLVTHGELIELDVATVRALEPAILHLIRNAYDHGLESSDERIQKNKPKDGVITLSLQRVGNHFLLTLKDDGAGIDIEAIQTRAKKLGLRKTQVRNPKEILGVLCQPGFSTKTEVSEVSGRGVGMDVVATQIANMGGQLSLKTKLGAGTIFGIKFAVPHLLVPCLVIQSGDLNFAIPTENVVKISSLEDLNTSPVENNIEGYDWIIQADNTSTPGLDLLNYWYPGSRLYSLNSTGVALYVDAQKGKKGIWLLADKLVGQSDLQVQPLPSPLSTPRGVMGVSLQAQEGLMPILEVGALIEYLLKASQQSVSANSVTEASENQTEDAQQPPEIAIPQSRVPKILIVDDAALVRRRIEASLAAYGYLTETCADGLEAWNWLQNHEHPNLVITDIEMPNMDGFTLIEKCRQAGVSIPILVISSRLAEEWGKEAYRIGATDFLTKGFSTVELLSKVNETLSM